jgi:hypothetical protein
MSGQRFFKISDNSFSHEEIFSAFIAVSTQTIIAHITAINFTLQIAQLLIFVKSVSFLYFFIEFANSSVFKFSGKSLNNSLAFSKIFHFFSAISEIFQFKIFIFSSISGDF